MNIIFDLDGTLIDSARDIQSVAQIILERRGKDGLSLEDVREFVGEGAAVFVSKMMAARGIDEDEATHAGIYDEFVAQYEFAVDKAVFYPSVVDVLANLKGSGHKLGLCTNKPELPARAVVKHMGMDGVFDAFLAGDMIDSRKPEPDMLLKSIEDLGGGTTLFVGDSEIDAETARRAQVPFALYAGGYHKVPLSQIHHDWRFDHFDALPDIVEKMMTMHQVAE